MSPAEPVTQCLYSPLATDPDLAEIVALFVEEMPNRVATLLQCLNDKNWESLRRTAHQLKGAAGSYGFGPVTPCAGRLESAIQDRLSEEEIRQSVQELVTLCGRIRSGTP
ncbi:MAG: Hpt domain-containing protein [Thermoguttaceae bacterium]